MPCAPRRPCFHAAHSNLSETRCNLYSFQHAGPDFFLTGPFPVPLRPQVHGSSCDLLGPILRPRASSADFETRTGRPPLGDIGGISLPLPAARSNVQRTPPQTRRQRTVPILASPTRLALLLASGTQTGKQTAFLRSSTGNRVGRDALPSTAARPGRGEGAQATPWVLAGR